MTNLRTRSVVLASSMASLLFISSYALAGEGGRCRLRYVDQSDRLPDFAELAGTSTTDIDLVDLDADGDLDLFITNGTDSLDTRENRVLVNDGAGHFSDESDERLPTRSDNSTKTAFGDLDGDGDLDALVANVGREQLLLNDGTGYFEDGADRLPEAPDLMLDISSYVELVDVDGDGDLDAVIANENPFDPVPEAGVQNRLLLNDGQARFSEAADRLPVSTDQTSAITSGDIDGDGDADIVVINRGQDHVLINDGDGTFSDETTRRLPAATDTGRSGGLVDMDGDGDLDLVVINSHNEPLALYLNHRGVVFRATSQQVEPLEGETATSVAFVDLDEDGDLDLYVTNAGANSEGHGFAGGPDRYLRNNGRGRLRDVTDQYFDPPSDASTALAFGDIDGDGDLDLVVGNTGDAGAERVFVRVDP